MHKRYSTSIKHLVIVLVISRQWVRGAEWGLSIYIYINIHTRYIKMMKTRG